MGTVVDKFAEAFRDFTTAGVPASGEHEPVKAEIRAVGVTIEKALAAVLGTVGVAKATRALLNADLNWPAETTGVVYADATDANNDLYVKTGASGAGGWTLTTILHNSAAALGQPYVTAATAQAAAAAVSAAAAESFTTTANNVALPPVFKIGQVTTPAAATAGSDLVIELPTPVLVNSNIQTVDLWAGTGMTAVIVKIFNSARNQVGADVSIPVTAGQRNILKAGAAFSSILIPAGHTVGLYGVGGRLHLNVAAEPKDTYRISAAGNQTTVSASVVTSGQAQFSVTTVPVADPFVRQDFERLEGIIAPLYQILNQTIGVPVLTAGGVAVLDFPFAFTETVVNDGWLIAARARFSSSGQFSFRTARRISGALVYTSGIITLAAAAGDNQWTAAGGHFSRVRVRAGDEIAFHGGAKLETITPSGLPYSTKSGGRITDQGIAAPLTLLATSQIQVGFEIEYSSLNVSPTPVQVPRSQTTAYMLGDSTVAAHLGGTAQASLISSARTIVNVAVPGDTIAQQKAAWLALTLATNIGWVSIQIGLNDINPAASTTAAKIAEIQDLVDTVRADVGAFVPIVICQMTPADGRWASLYPASTAAAKQRWRDMNEAIAGGGATPITGVEVRVTAHVDLLATSPGTDNYSLAAAYDTGDGIHTNTAGRQVNVTAIENRMDLEGYAA